MLTSILCPALGVLVAATAAPYSIGAHRTAFDVEDVLAKSRAAYAALTSYADSGTVAEESNGFTTHSTFRLRFSRKPHQLLIDSRLIESLYQNGHRVPLNRHVVLWLENGDLQTWRGATQEHETYPAAGGQQVNALKHATLSTAGISVLMPSLLYTRAGMVSSVHATEEAEADGFETVSGRRCYRMRGV